MNVRTPVLSGALVAALGVLTAASSAGALQVARQSRLGYVMVDEPGAAAPTGGRFPTQNDAALAQLVGDATAAIDAAGGAHVDYLAFLQETRDSSIISFYVAVSNATTGLGLGAASGTGREVFDLNAQFGTAFPLRGVLFLNNVGLYRGTTATFARTLLCPQEFAHGTGAFVRVPPAPAASGDGGVDDGGSAPPVPANALLGRGDEHWSFFLNTGGSPMEGNNWVEESPGVFHTGPFASRFSPLDLYLMGLAPASDVPPFWLIAEPAVMGQTDDTGATITRQSDPLLSGRVVTVRGRRVTYTLDDVVRANGPRRPAFGETGAGVPGPDLRVAWVLLTTTPRLTDGLVNQFDDAIAGCAAGYAQATGDRGHLVPTVGPAASNDAGADDAAVDAPGGDGPTPEDAPGDAPVAMDSGTDGGVPPAPAGCGCVVPAGAPRSRGVALAVGVGLLLARPRRRTRGAGRHAGVQHARQVLELEGLAHDRSCASTPDLRVQRVVAEGGHHDDGNRRGKRAHPGQRLEPRVAGHVHVGDDRVHGRAATGGEEPVGHLAHQLGAVGRLHHVVAATPEGARHQRA